MSNIIAMIDDDIDDLFFYREILADLDGNLIVEQFNNAKNFIDKYTDSTSEKPNLVLLDLNMPKISGIQFIETIKSYPSMSDMPIVILTTSSSPLDIADCKSKGINSYFIKPMHYEDCKLLMRSIYEYWFVYNKVNSI